MKKGKTFNLTLGFMFAGCVIFAQSIEREWATGMGSSSHNWEYGAVIKTNTSEGTYTAGRFWDTVDFDPGAGIFNLEAVGGANGFVLHVDAAGDLVWVSGFKGHGDAESGVSSQVNGLDSDEGDNIYVTGEFSGKVDFDPGPDTMLLTSTYDPASNTYKADAFLLSLNGSGNLRWVRKIGGPSPDRGEEIVLDNHGYIYIAGTFLDLTVFDSATGVSLPSYGNSDIFLSKFDTAGNFIWTKQIGGPNGDYAYGLASDHMGNIFLSGGFSGTCDFNNGLGTDTLTSTYAGEIFTAKYDSAGVFQWVRNIVGSAHRSVLSHALLADDKGDVYTAGRFEGAADFNPEGTGFPLTAGSMLVFGQPVPGQDGFIQKRDADGNFVWAKKIGGEGSLENEIRSMALDASGGHIYLTGAFQGEADFDPGPDTFSVVSMTGSLMGMDFPTPDAFIAKIDTGGIFQWAEGLGGLASELSRSVAVDGFGAVYLTGDFNGTGGPGDFGVRPDTFPVLSNGANDIFIAKYFECLSLDSTVGIEGPDSICLHTAYTYSVQVPAAVSFDWEVPGDWSVSTHAQEIEITAAGTGGTIHVTAFGRCDTITITKDVALKIPKAHITVDNFTLSTASPDYDSWQWYLEGHPIAGATNASHTVSENGAYSVVVTGAGCVDTAYYTVTNVTGIGSEKALPEQIAVYPNPTSEMIQISSPVAIHARLLNTTGQHIRWVENVQSFSIRDIASGIYFLQIIHAEDNRLIKVEKVVKQ